MNRLDSKERTRNYLYQVKGTVVYKAAGMSASLLVVPLMIDYLGPEQFGVWSTLLTIMSWVLIFDIGVGNGLRNKVAEAIAQEQYTEARKYIASGYSFIGLIVILVWGIILFSSYLIQWQKAFNTQAITEISLRETVLITSFFLVGNFWFNLIAAILGALQKTSIIALGQAVANISILAFVYILGETSDGSISRLAYVYGFSLIASNFILSYWFFKKNKYLRPFLYLNKKYLKPLLSIGLKFLIIQLAVLVIFMSDKILITHLFGPQEVVQYDVVYKLFSIIIFTHSVISMPLWSAYTDAYYKRDFNWIRGVLKRQIVVISVVLIAVATLIPLAKPIITIWIGPDLLIDTSLLVSMGIFVLISCWVNIYAYFLNGVQKIHLSLVISIFAMLLNIPISIVLAKYTDLGVSSVVIGTIVALLPGVVMGPLQTLKIINKKDNGIWSR